MVVQLVACDSPAGRLGLTICYDLRFPEVYQELAFKQGAQILLAPSAFTKLTGVICNGACNGGWICDQLIFYGSSALVCSTDPLSGAKLHHCLSGKWRAS